MAISYLFTCIRERVILPQNVYVTKSRKGKEIVAYLYYHKKLTLLEVLALAKKPRFITTIKAKKQNQFLLKEQN